ncbi:MAG: UbiD family decarboxylase [Chloroflexi bacterium]|nr:UbiD family decarboxylase [Chloroflexota bacterium]
MSYKDMRGWLAKIEDFGELRRVDGADLEKELGAVYELSWSKRSLPTIIYDRIPGYRPGYRIVTSAQSPRSVALTLGIPVGHDVLKMTQALREKVFEVRRIPPKVVDSGPILENVRLDGDVDLMEFPAPKWHELDGGAYMGTGDLVMTRDPDEGWVNVGTYRIQRHDRNTVGLYISPGKHGRIHREKYYSRGEPCPVAISFGHDPLLCVAASASLPWGVCEYEYAGGLKGEPIEVITGPVTGLPIPAHSELAIEGYTYPGETKLEGPFGEYAGYYASGERQEPFIHVKSVLHRNDPIIYGTPPLKPRAGAVGNIMRAATIWNGLERVGIPGVMGVAVYVRYFITVVSIKQLFPGHSKQVGAVAGQIPPGAYSGRLVIVVDDDIDPTNLDEVIWALATRSDPALSIDFLHRCWSTPLDPMSNTGLLEDGPRVFNSRAIIDACIPYELKSRNLFPAVVGTSPDLLASVEAKFGALLE